MLTASPHCERIRWSIHASTHTHLCCVKPNKFKCDCVTQFSNVAIATINITRAKSRALGVLSISLRYCEMCAGKVTLQAAIISRVSGNMWSQGLGKGGLSEGGGGVDGKIIGGISQYSTFEVKHNNNKKHNVMLLNRVRSSSYRRLHFSQQE